ncbi:MAG TPA: hypothetical protein VMT53_10145 [Terriglobales bacterium]|nr:hypothetical protein [Terriglobales bacterium]
MPGGIDQALKEIAQIKAEVDAIPKQIESLQFNVQRNLEHSLLQMIDMLLKIQEDLILFRDVSNI